ncbi:MAG TPA: hypothetical protein VN457_05425, partial [Chlamydiales bacterium]|nr:hypothetical protein [Chlamydiales bacterium]
GDQRHLMLKSDAGFMEKALGASGKEIEKFLSDKKIDTSIAKDLIKFKDLLRHDVDAAFDLLTDPKRSAASKEALLRGCPLDLFSRKNDDGNTLIHLLCRFEEESELGQIVVARATPQQLALQNMKGETAFHLACKNSHDVALLLLEKTPKSALKDLPKEALAFIVTIANVSGRIKEQIEECLYDLIRSGTADNNEVTYVINSTFVLRDEPVPERFARLQEGKKDLEALKNALKNNHLEAAITLIQNSANLQFVHPKELAAVFVTSCRELDSTTISTLVRKMPLETFTHLQAHISTLDDAAVKKFTERAFYFAFNSVESSDHKDAQKLVALMSTIYANIDKTDISKKDLFDTFQNVFAKLTPDESSFLFWTTEGTLEHLPLSAISLLHNLPKEYYQSSGMLKKLQAAAKGLVKQFGIEAFNEAVKVKSNRMAHLLFSETPIDQIKNLPKEAAAVLRELPDSFYEQQFGILDTRPRDRWDKAKAAVNDLIDNRLVNGLSCDELLSTIAICSRGFTKGSEKFIHRLQQGTPPKEVAAFTGALRSDRVDEALEQLKSMPVPDLFLALVPQSVIRNHGEALLESVCFENRFATIAEHVISVVPDTTALSFLKSQFQDKSASDVVKKMRELPHAFFMDPSESRVFLENTLYTILSTQPRPEDFNYMEALRILSGPLQMAAYPERFIQCLASQPAIRELRETLEAQNPDGTFKTLNGLLHDKLT